MKFPIYKLDIKKLKEIENNSDAGVFCISLVDNPAIERSFHKFHNQEVKEQPKQIVFTHFNDDKRIISGFAMIPNLPIYRYDDQTGEEYFIKYSVEDIEYLQNLFMSKKDIHSTNIMHNPSLKLSKDDIYLFESFIIDNKRGITVDKKYGNPVNGSWFVSYKVLNDNLWNDLKTGKTKLTGFSVELGGYHKPIEENNFEIDETIIDELIKIINS